jgi:hypothetical protein
MAARAMPALYSRGHAHNEVVNFHKNVFGKAPCDSGPCSSVVFYSEVPHIPFHTFSKTGGIVTMGEDGNSQQYLVLKFQFTIFKFQFTVSNN